MGCGNWESRGGSVIEGRGTYRRKGSLFVLGSVLSFEIVYYLSTQNSQENEHSDCAEY